MQKKNIEGKNIFNIVKHNPEHTPLYDFKYRNSAKLTEHKLNVKEDIGLTV